MTIEGELTVRLAWDGARVCAVDIRSTRPLAVPAVLQGRTVDSAAALVPRLFSVCAHAQGAAAAGALGAASGREGKESLHMARSLAIRLEAIQESLRRLLIDAPVAQGLAPEVAAVARVRKTIAPLLGRLAGATTSLRDACEPIALSALAEARSAIADVCKTDALGMTPARWLAAGGADDVRAWSARGATVPSRLVHAWLVHDARLGSSDVAPMPATDRAALESHVLSALSADAGFAHAPTWDDAPVETGAYARLASHPRVADCARAYGNGIVTRMVARLTELAQQVDTLGAAPAGIVDAWAPAAGEGVAAVQTVRGLLVHRATVRDGRVTRYAIVAPTEWNFHPRGALARGLAGVADPSIDSLRRRAALVVQALDPCVGCTVEIGHA
jgi:Ni,Fe-hydrogenase I large subunit